MLTWPDCTAPLISGIGNSEALSYTVTSSRPPVALRSSSTNQRTVWVRKLAST